MKKPGYWVPLNENRSTMVYPIPLSDLFVAQLVLPRALCKQDADKLCAVIKALIQPPDTSGRNDME